MAFKNFIDLEGIECQEASILSRETHIPCAKPASALVWHERDQRAYPMCPGCTSHNLANRGGRLLATTQEEEPHASAPRPLANTNEIYAFWHCRKCLEELPIGTSPQDWARISAGFTKPGIQVWCNRHERNIVHIDFEGQTHPANMSAAAEKGQWHLLHLQPGRRDRP